MSRACSRTEFDSSQNQNRLWVRSILAGLLLLILAFSGSSASAQQVYGSIGGSVIDSSGGAVSDAKVTITDTGRNIVYNTTTNPSGAFMQL